MSIIQANGAGLGGAGAPGGALAGGGILGSHAINQSLRFESGDTAYLYKTWGSAADSNQIYTFSCWFKRGNLGNSGIVNFISSINTGSGTGQGSNHYGFYNNDKLSYYTENGGENAYTKRVFRDPSAWYHVTYQYDTTQSTATDRLKIYLNGVNIPQGSDNWTSAGFGFPETPALNSVMTSMNQNGRLNAIGAGINNSVNRFYFDGYLAEVIMLDGVTTDCTAFGEFVDGVWVPKAYSGSYGTNGYKLDFSDSNYIGRDKSGSKTLVTSPSFSTFGGGDTNFTQANYDRAFNNILTDSSCDRTGSGGIIDITPSSSVTPVSHTMINASSSAYTAASRPNSVLLQGSNDGGSNWTTIDDLTNGSGANTATTSSFSNTTSYAKLRLNISENHGGSNTRFAEYVVIASEDNGDGENIFFNTNLAVSDVVPDSPTNNFATMNVLDNNSITFSEGNLKVKPTADYRAVRGTFGIPTSGKWYFEARILTPGGGNVQDNQIGVATQENVLTGSSPYPQAFTYGVGYIGSGQINRGGSAAQTSLTAFTAGKILGVAVNVDDNQVQFYLDGSAVGTTHALVSTTEPNFAFYVGATDRGAVFNFGQDSTFAGAITAGGNADANSIGDFKYAPPSGFLALCSANLPEPVIGPGQTNQADDFFEPILYTGNGGTQHIGSGGIQHPQDTTTIANSVRFDDGDSAHLSRTPSSSGNRKTYTISLWFKRGNISTAFPTLIGANVSSGRDDAIRFGNNSGGNELYIFFDEASKALRTNRTFTNTSTWHHLVLAVDTTQATDTDRVKLYIDGTQETSFASSTYPAQDYEGGFNRAGQHSIGKRPQGNYFDGYIAEVNVIDGTALDPTYFGQIGSNGYWIPKALSGLTYGTNGFRLTFQNSSYLGYDYQTSGRSGNTNDFTVTNLAATDQVIDSPTQNFSTMDPNRYSGIGTFSEGNLTVATSTNNRATYGTIAVPSSGKWYYEVRVDSYASGGGAYMGWGTNVAEGDNEYAADHGISFSSYNEQVLLDNSGQSGGYGSNGTNVASNGDVYSVLLDVDNGLFYYAKNGTYFNSANPSNGTGGLSVGSVLAGAATEIRPMLTRGGSYNETYTFNFGQDPSFNGGETAPGTDKTDANGVGKFLYDVPTGFLALMDDNIPQEGVESPDFVWIKERNNNSKSHYLFDTVRGATKNLHTDSTAAEATDTDSLLSFDYQGFTVGSNGDVNGSADTYVAWNWKAGGIAPTKTYTVKVVSDSGNKYRFDDFGTSAVTLELQEGGTYTFDQSDSSNSGHPLRFSTTSNGTHGGGSEYTTGVTTTGTPGTTGAKTVITVGHGAPILYYYCTQHSGMGGQANTNTTHGSSNFDGSLQSVVSVALDAGFSIVTWTAPNDNGTVGHGLNSAPELIIAKPLGSGTNWYVMHTPGEVVPANQILNLDSTTGKFNPGVNHFNDTYPTDTVFSYGGYLGDDLSNDDKVAYCFHSVDGFSKVGSYIGNNSTDGPFSFTGFRPAWLMLKRSDSAASWLIYDNKRDTFNQMQFPLFADLADDEYASNLLHIDFLSNGFKVRNATYGETNASGGTYIYLAFAEQPFKFANAR